MNVFIVTRLKQPASFVFVLTIILIVSFALRADAFYTKTAIGHDEAISYLSATCHQYDYSQAAFDVTPVPAAYWKKFILHPEHPFCFDQIQIDLAHYDIHPPLYFWLLHLWSLLVGVQIWTGPLLNSFISILTTASLIGLASYTLRYRFEVFLVTLTYALNPSIVLVSLEARHYDLLALWTVLLVWQTVRYTNESGVHKWQHFIGLSLVTILGALTQYQFVLVVTGCAAFAVLRLIKTDRQRLAWFLAALALGCVVALVVHPYFFTAFQRQAGGIPVKTLANWLIRLDRVAIAFRAFYYLALAIGFVLIVGVVVQVGRKKLSLKRYVCEMNWHGVYILFFFFWIAGALIVQYLAFLSPTHAMGPPKYLSMAWPFLAFLPVFVWRVVNYRGSLVLYLVMVPILLGLLFPVKMRILGTATPARPAPLLAQPDLIVVDNPARGVLLPLVWFMPDDTPVIVASQDSLLGQPDTWLAYLDEKSLYVSELSEPNSEEKLTHILDKIVEAGFEVELVAGSLDPAYGVYTVNSAANGH